MKKVLIGIIFYVGFSAILMMSLMLIMVLKQNNIIDSIVNIDTVKFSIYNVVFCLILILIFSKQFNRLYLVKE